jgi:hypothetical protein
MSSDVACEPPRSNGLQHEADPVANVCNSQERHSSGLRFGGALAAKHIVTILPEDFALPVVLPPLDQQRRHCRQLVAFANAGLMN